MFLPRPDQPSGGDESGCGRRVCPRSGEADGTAVVERREEHRAEDADIVVTRPVVDVAELAQRLFADPDGDRDTPRSRTLDLIARLNPHLDDAELVLLSHAVDNQDDVLISYRNKNGGHTVRQIRPHQLNGRWLDSFCHLRAADREFTVANIESVAPAP